jgi:hypothetical protein
LPCSGLARGCRQLLAASLVAIEDLVFDVSAQPPRALIRPREGLQVRGTPVELTAAQLAAPAGRWPFGKQGAGVPPEPIINDFCYGTAIDLFLAPPGATYETLPALAPNVGLAKLVQAIGQRDTMFSCNFTVETWRRPGLWKVSDVVEVVLARYRVVHEPNVESCVWGSSNLGGSWALSQNSDTPGQFAIVPHLFYHYALDVTGSQTNNCAIV